MQTTTIRGRHNATRSITAAAAIARAQIVVAPGQLVQVEVLNPDTVNAMHAELTREQQELSAATLQQSTYPLKCGASFSELIQNCSNQSETWYLNYVRSSDASADVTAYLRATERQPVRGL